MSVKPIELRRLPLFATLPPSAMAALAAIAQARTYRRGEILFCAGDPCPAILVVGDGFVRLSRPGPDGHDATVAIVGQGGILGTAALLGHPAHETTAEALGRVQAIDFPVAALAALADRSPEAIVPLLQALAVRLDEAWIDVTGDAAATVRARVLHVLRRVVRESGGFGTGGGEVPARLAVRLSHAELARLVGARRTTVTRELRALAAQGEVVRERGHVIGVATHGKEQTGSA